MLASLLPGLRNLRASFTAGALTLTAVYIIFAEALIAAVQDEHLNVGLISLRDLLSEGGWVVVASVAAYLLGSAFMAIRERLVKLLAASLVSRNAASSYLDQPGSERFAMSLLRPFSRASVRRLGTIKSKDYNPLIAGRACIDIIMGDGARLLVEHKDLHTEFDRLRAEAEFRDAIAIPGALLAITILFSMSPELLWAWLVAAFTILLTLIVLFAQARDLDRRARSIHAHAVADGIVSTASLDSPEKRHYIRWFGPDQETNPVNDDA